MPESDSIPILNIPQLPRRSPDGHKGTYGKVLIIAGSRGMSGAAVLCGRAALRSGAGLVQVACPTCVQSEVASGHPCYTTYGIRQHTDGSFGDGVLSDLLDQARTARALAIGPGHGHSADVASLVSSVINELPHLPIVVDADALNALSPFKPLSRSRTLPLVLTPHPGEFARLTGHAVPSRPEQEARSFAERYGVVLVLKGMGTVVTDGRRVFRNTTGNPGMATGGSGDVLTGTIAAVLSQGLSPFDAAVLGTWVHGRAGDLAAAHWGQIGLTAADLPDALAAAFLELQRAS